jgi:uncharacterized membrane protein YbhN (UPF0104 family)
LAGLYVKSHLEEFRLLLAKPIGAGLWAAVFVSVGLSLIVNSEILRLGIRALGVPLGPWEGLALNMSTMAANYFIPFKGGAGLRAYYLATRYRMTLADFFAQILVVSVVALSTGSLLAFLGLLVAAPDQAQWPLLTYFGGTFLLGWSSIFWVGRLSFARRRPRLAALAHGWDAFRANPGVLWRLAIYQTAFFLVLAQANRLCFTAFGVDLGFGQALFYSTVQIHSTIVNLTPAGLGVVEAFAVLTGKALGFDPPQALLAQGLNRLAQLSLLVLIGLIGWPRLRRQPLAPPKAAAGPETERPPEPGSAGLGPEKPPDSEAA